MQKNSQIQPHIQKDKKTTDQLQLIHQLTDPTQIQHIPPYNNMHQYKLIPRYTFTSKTINNQTPYVLLSSHIIQKIIQSAPVQMLIPHTDPPTASLRLLCYDIENDINRLLTNHTSKPHPPNPQTQTTSNKSIHDPTRASQERSLEQLKNSIVQTVTARLPQVINFQQTLKENIEDLTEERDQWHEKYKKMFALYEQLQLSNDKLKIEVIALSDNYEHLSLNYEQLKYQYHELKQKETDSQMHQNEQIYLQKIAELNKLNSNSNSNSLDSDRDNAKTENDVMNYERELFLEEIRQSQKDILVFKSKIEELIEEKESALKEKTEFSDLLKGEKSRSDKLDRQILEILNKNQQLKLQIAEQKQAITSLQLQKQQQSRLLQKKGEEYGQQRAINEKLNGEAVQLKNQIMKLRFQNSQNRQKYDQLQEVQRQLKGKINEMKKQNQQLRLQVEKMMAQHSSTLTTLQNQHSLQLKKLQNQVGSLTANNRVTEKQIKLKSNQKMQQICKMHKDISSKLQHKIGLLQKECKQRKQKSSQLKYQVQRLYQSLQMQVQKQFKITQKYKELSEQHSQLMKTKDQIQRRLTETEANEDVTNKKFKQTKFELQRKQKQLKRITDIHFKLTKLILPKIKEELFSTRLACQHLTKTVQMEKEQTTFLLQKRQQHFQQLLSQTLMQTSLSTQQQTFTYSSELNKWKETCKNYEQKYSKLKESHQYLTEKQLKSQKQHARLLQQQMEKAQNLQDKMQKQQLEHLGTLKTIDKLKQKCKQVEQYYKLVDELEKQNAKLKEKLVSIELTSFKISQHPIDHNHTRPRHKFTEQHTHKHNKTVNSPKVPAHLNDITTKAQFQRMRLEAVKRQYDLVNRPQY